MPQLLLICDPPLKLGRGLIAALSLRGMDVGYLNHASECYGAVQAYRPDFLIVASGTQPAPLDRTMRWMARADGESDRARVFLTGDASSAELADQWQWPRELCLPRPIDASTLIRLLFETTGTTSATT